MNIIYRTIPLVLGLTIAATGASNASSSTNEYMGFKIGGDNYEKTLSFIKSEMEATNNPYLLRDYGKRINNPIPVKDIELQDFKEIYTPAKTSTKALLTFSNIDNDKLYKLHVSWRSNDVEPLYKELQDAITQKYQDCKEVVINKSYGVYGTECSDGSVDILLSNNDGISVSIEYSNRLMARKIDKYMDQLTQESGNQGSKAKI